MGGDLSKRVRQLIWRVEHTPGWHAEMKRGGRRVKLTGPRGQLVFASTATKDYRGVRNLEAQLRQAGIEFP